MTVPIPIKNKKPTKEELKKIGEALRNKKMYSRADIEKALLKTIKTEHNFIGEMEIETPIDKTHPLVEEFFENLKHNY